MVNNQDNDGPLNEWIYIEKAKEWWSVGDTALLNWKNYLEKGKIMVPGGPYLIELKEFMMKNKKNDGPWGGYLIGLIDLWWEIDIMIVPWEP